MKIAALIKQVPDTETKIRIKPTGDGIEEGDVKFIMNPYCEFAVEEALQTKAKIPGSETFVITVGPQRSVEALRTALAMGIDKAIHIDQEGQFLDSTLTAKALAKVLKDKGINIIFTGKQAIDGYHSQVTQMIAEFLDVPQVMIAEKVELSADKQGAKVTKRVAGGAKEVYEMKFPSIIGCEKGINTPRYASLPGIMKAKSKPVEAIKISTLLEGATPKVKYINYQLPPERQAGKKLAGEPAEQAAALIKLLREEAKVI